MRGALEIHPAVFRKVAAHAVGLVPGASGGASVRIDSPDVDVAVKLTLRYPMPVRAAVADVRRSVAEEVERVTGYRVRRVSVTVSALRASSRSVG